MARDELLQGHEMERFAKIYSNADKIAQEKNGETLNALKEQGKTSEIRAAIQEATDAVDQPRSSRSLK
jgi:hypothetical protein